MKFNISVIIIITLILWLPPHSFAQNDDDEKETESILPLTGRYEKIATEQKKAILLWQRLFNENRRFRNGKRMKVRFHDYGGKPEEAVQTVNYLKEKYESKSIIGPTSLGAIAAIKPLAEKYKIPFLVMTSSPDAIKPESNWVFNLGPTSISVARAVFNHIVISNLKRVAFIVDDTPWGLKNLKLLKELVSDYKLEHVGDFVAPIKSPDFESILNRVRNKKPQAIVSWVPSGFYRNLVNQWSRLHISVPLYLNQFGVLVLPSHLSEKVRIPVPPWMVADQLDRSEELNIKIRDKSLYFMNEYRRVYQQDPGLFAGYAWDAIGVMTDAEDDDCEEDSERIRNFLVKTRDYPGINGSITISKKNPVGLSWEDFYIVEIRDRKYRILRKKK